MTNSHIKHVLVYNDTRVVYSILKSLITLGILAMKK